MEIRINGENLEFSLEREDALQEILLAVEQFLQTHGHFTYAVVVDGKEFQSEDIKNSKLEASQINLIEVTSHNILRKANDMLENLSKDIKSMLSLSVEQIFSKKEIILSTLHSIYKQTDVLSNFLIVPFIYVFSKENYMKIDMEEYLSLINSLEEKIRDEKFFQHIFTVSIVPILSILQDIYLPKMMEVYDLLFQTQETYINEEFLGKLAVVKQEILVSLENVSHVTTLFQMGDDKRAIQGLEILLIAYEFTSQLVLRCSFLKLLDTEEVAAVQEKLQKNIQEIDTALVKKDIIMLCDILEYEYAQNFQELLNLLPSPSTKEKD